jgi:hypothetical protein
MIANEKLARLYVALEKLLAMMLLDPKSPWTNKFVNDKNFCDSLLRKTPSIEDLTSLSKSIIDVYQGMGSFNDYAPAVFDQKTGRYAPIPGTECFSDLASEVFNLAIELRVKK